MRSSKVILAVILISIIACLTGRCAKLESVQNDKVKRMNVAMEKEKLPRPDISSTPLPDKVSDPDVYWRTLTSPDTTYAQRMALAMHGLDYFSPEFVPNLMEARALLDREQRLHYFGLKQHPCDMVMFEVERSIKSLENIPEGQRTRHILGHEWVIPREESEYPITWDEEVKAPWPWQVQKALDKLFYTCKNGKDCSKRVDGLTRDEFRDRWVKAALTMPYSTDDEARSFIEATAIWPPKPGSAVSARWLKIALDPKCDQASMYAVMSTSSDIRGPLAHAMLAKILVESPNRFGRRRAAEGLKDLRRPWRKDQGDKLLPVPATGVLAASRIALDPKQSDKWERLAAYAYSVCVTVDDPPFKPNWQLDIQSSEVDEYLKQFRKWFDAHEPGLIAASEKEKPELDSALKEIGYLSK